MAGTVGQGPQAWWRAQGRGHVVSGSSLEGCERAAERVLCQPRHWVLWVGAAELRLGTEQGLALGTEHPWRWARPWRGSRA